MVLHSCFHSRYIAMLFFFFTASLRKCQGPIWPCLCCIQPNLSFSSWWRTTNVPHTSHFPPHYSSSHLSRETSLFTSSTTILLRQVIRSFTDSDPLRKFPGWLCRRTYLGSFLCSPFGFPALRCYPHTVYSRSIHLFLCALLAPVNCLFTLTLLSLASCLVFRSRLSELFSTHSQMSYAISALFLQDFLN